MGVGTRELRPGRLSWVRAQGSSTSATAGAARESSRESFFPAIAGVGTGELRLGHRGRATGELRPGHYAATVGVAWESIILGISTGIVLVI